MLSASGFTFQMLFSNPLVEPGFLGVSQGSAFGAALMIVLGTASSVLVQVSATVFGLGALLASYLLAQRFRLEALCFASFSAALPFQPSSPVHWAS
jgi:iron complex transport system permease protein